MTHHGSDLVSGRFAVDHPLCVLQDFFGTRQSRHRYISHHPQDGAHHRHSNQLTEQHLLDSDWLLLITFCSQLLMMMMMMCSLWAVQSDWIWRTGGGGGGRGGRGEVRRSQQPADWTVTQQLTELTFSLEKVVSLMSSADQSEQMLKWQKMIRSDFINSQ